MGKRKIHFETGRYLACGLSKVGMAGMGGGALWVKDKKFVTCKRCKDKIREWENKKK
jgi:hypothetical protein